LKPKYPSLTEVIDNYRIQNGFLMRKHYEWKNDTSHGSIYWDGISWYQGQDIRTHIKLCGRKVPIGAIVWMVFHGENIPEGAIVQRLDSGKPFTPDNLILSYRTYIYEEDSAC
jgi:hypothetical protein